MREIVFDTETTGVNFKDGDRVVEIGMVELFDLIPTGNTFHTYVNPIIPMPVEAQRIHGLSSEFLRQHPTFADPQVVDAMLEFIGDAQLVAHNAEFDRGFLNAELKRLGKPLIGKERCVDTVVIARKKHPGAPASLDALCRRYSIDTSERGFHGALLDARLLSAVYLELMGGAERRLALYDEASEVSASGSILAPGSWPVHPPRPRALRPLITEREQEAHAAFIKGLAAPALWNQPSQA
ncbi:MAG: DNA polymerase III subunit epsilon [Hyphomonadaceae bacterium]|jgi:DNA polymerase-3 subunit epsilon|nr:DNA polymerase III subunit epsilon [Hyphomonadaceae bacterium]